MTTLGNPANLPSFRLAVLLLAAGEGSRLGSIPKALIQKDGQSLIRRFYQAIQPLFPIEFLVLTGFHAQAIESEIALLNHEMHLQAKVICHPNPQEGQASSVRLGIESLQSQYDVLLIALSDQPEITHTEIAALLAQFERRQEGHEIILPTVHGLRGNPVLFSRKVIEDILEIPGMVCRAYMDSHPELVEIFETPQLAYVVDVDTPADMSELKLRQP